MIVTLVCDDEVPDTKLKAVVAGVQGDTVSLIFRQEKARGDYIIIALPARMLSCAETIARVFNECLAGGQVVALPDCENPGAEPELQVAPADDRGQYIGLARTDDLYYPFRHVE